MVNENDNDNSPNWAKIGCGGCGGLVAFAVLLGIIGALFSDDGPDEGMARVMCEGFVEDRLKSPSSADFSRPTITSAGVDTWTVTGTVDSANSFGAMKRITYTCKVRGDDNGKWTLLDLQHHER